MSARANSASGTVTPIALLVSVIAHFAADVTMARVRRERRLEAGTDFPDAREIKRLLAAATTSQQRALLLTAALTGLRASELRGLRWTDVHLEIGELQVRQRADQFAKIGEPKARPGPEPLSRQPGFLPDAPSE